MSTQEASAPAPAQRSSTLSADAVIFPEIDFGRDEVPDFHDVILKLREHGSVVPVKFGGMPAWAILDYADVAHAFADLENFNQYDGFRILAGPSQGHTLQTMEPAEHRVKRALVAGFFLPRAVRDYVAQHIEPIAHDIADRLDVAGDVNFVENFSRPFPFSIITRLLGLPVVDEPQFLRWAIKLIEYPSDPVGALTAKAEFDSYVLSVIEERRRKPREDLLTQLTQAEFEGTRLNDEEILAFCRILYPAGSDTAYKAIGSMFAHVLTHDGIKEKALRGPRDREQIAAESLRWESPLPMQPMLASGRIRMGDVQISPGDWTLLSIGAANRDPALFTRPERFDPDRDNRNLITFGKGPHFCLGMHLARRELEVALQIVLERFPKMRIKPDTPVEIIGGILRGPRALWVQSHGGT